MSWMVKALNFAAWRVAFEEAAGCRDGELHWFQSSGLHERSHGTGCRQVNDGDEFAGMVAT